VRIAVFSGCAWGDCGGGQRPPQLARALARLRHEVSYVANIESEDREADGVRILREDSWREQARGGTGQPGIVIYGHPGYMEHVRPLVAAGWLPIYDLLDDWDGFVAAGVAPAAWFAEEPEAVATAEMVLCTAPRLVERAVRMGARRTALVRNGGPAGRIAPPRSPRERGDGMGPSNRGAVRAVFCGYLGGPWIDWGAVEALCGDRGIEVTIIGDHGQPPKSCRGATFLGRMAWVDALAEMTRHDVGIVPFRLDLSRSVDPIKAYDYWAAGLWCVATPELEPMHGRPCTLIATAKKFPGAVKRAAGLRLTDPPDEDLVAGGSWDRRAAQIVGIIEGLRKPIPYNMRPPERMIPAVAWPPVGIKGEDCRLRLTWEAPATCNMGPACPYCCNVETRAGLPALSAPRWEWIEAFAVLAKQHGPLYLTACYGEPTSDRDTMRVLARVAAANKVDICSNLVDTSLLALLPRNGNVAVATSWHPLAWGGERAASSAPTGDGGIEAFLARRREVERSGIACGWATVVAWPGWVERIPEWRAALQREIEYVDILPYYGMFEGREYPTAYTPEEWALMGATGGQAGHTTAPTGGLCRTGAEYLFVSWDGTARRCYMPQARVLGNVLRGNVELLAGATPCEAPTCACSGLWSYREAVSPSPALPANGEGEKRGTTGG